MILNQGYNAFQGMFGKSGASFARYNVYSSVVGS